MVVVADTSPINYLVLIEQIDLLPRQEVDLLDENEVVDWRSVCDDNHVCSNLRFCRPELAERFPVLLEIGSREIVDFVLLQKGVHLHPRFENKQPAKLSRRKRMGRSEERRVGKECR